MTWPGRAPDLLAAALRVEGQPKTGDRTSHTVTCGVELGTDRALALRHLTTKLGLYLALSLSPVETTTTVQGLTVYRWEVRFNDTIRTVQRVFTPASLALARFDPVEYERQGARTELGISIVERIELAPVVMAYPGHHVDSSLDPPALTGDLTITPVVLGRAGSAANPVPR